MTDPAAASDPEVLDLVRRLRGWNVSSWRHRDRVSVTRSTLNVLAALAADHDGMARPAVPDVGVHALADQLMVLIADALRAGAEVDRVGDVLAELSAGLGLAPR